eukprot:scaffold5150_cov133-Skeletonema_menzelii.AAC.6
MVRHQSTFNLRDLIAAGLKALAIYYDYDRENTKVHSRVITNNSHEKLLNSLLNHADDTSKE